jgi:hypothetical protein
MNPPEHGGTRRIPLTRLDEAVVAQLPGLRGEVDAAPDRPPAAPPVLEPRRLRTTSRVSGADVEELGVVLPNSTTSTALFGQMRESRRFPLTNRVSPAWRAGKGFTAAPELSVPVR